MDTQARIDAAKARLGENREVLTEALKAGPACLGCRHSRKTMVKNVARCGHPALVKPVFNIPAGKLKIHVLATIQEARAADGVCGPEAVLFERKPLLIRLLGL